MAIQFARIKIHSRKNGANACRTSAYNARSKITDEKTGEVFDFTKKGGNVYHQVLLPEGANEKFKDISILSNAIEKREKKSNSQLLKEAVIALPDDDEFTLEDRINITHLIIKEMGWVENGLAVQIDIHEPDEDDNNWHAHVLVQTRRFTECGNYLGNKARDLNPEFKTGKGKSFIVPEEDIIHEKLKRVINNYCIKMGYETRVDPTGKIAQMHIGPVRMRSSANPAIDYNEDVKRFNAKYLNSGKRLLERVTNNQSVFKINDLKRAVKIVPDPLAREKLIEKALNSKSIIRLYDKKGKETGYFTTTQIREEEAKLMRLSSYIVDSKNIMTNSGEKIRSIVHDLIQVENSKTDRQEPNALTTEQSAALSYLLLGESGLKIMRGRAGTGKSHVLGRIAKIANTAGINVVGLGPTHKARAELAKVGYEQNYTVKGMLFQLYNGQTTITKGSLIVVDEAAMISNADYLELVRVAANKGWTVILSGDEKQITSVQRGGMFEEFATKYGSTTVFNIQRQQNAWGRDVAVAFSKGNAAKGVSILQENNRIVSNKDRDESMRRLLSDWSNDKRLIGDKLIIAVKNEDVDALNRGAREYLKLSGDLRGKEIAVNGKNYMKGDRILITKSDKDLGLVNGDFAKVLHASKERFVIIVESAVGLKGADKVDQKNNAINSIADSTAIDKANDNSKVIEFNPAKYSGFTLGYAVTIFKTQGASIKNVFVFHNGFAGIRNIYVALSRNIEDVRLYINKEATKNIDSLIKQLSSDPNAKGSTLNSFTLQDLAEQKLKSGFKEEDQGLFSRVLSSAATYTKNRITKFNDKHFIDTRYYRFTAKPVTNYVDEVTEYVGAALEQKAVGSNVYLDIEGLEEQVLEKAVVGGNQGLNTSNNMTNQLSQNIMTNNNTTKLTIKERFYAKADLVRGQSAKQSGASEARLQKNSLEQKAQWDIDSERLRSEVKFKAESIAKGILGEPNKSLSNGRTLRYGKNGKLVVSISGEQMGSWYDFSAGRGGDMFALVKEKQNCDFKGAVEYLRNRVGLSAGNNNMISLVNENKNNDRIKDHIKVKQIEERLAKSKALQVQRLYARAKDIGTKSIAYKYLTQHRGVNSNINLGRDIRTAGVLVSNNIDNSKTNNNEVISNTDNNNTTHTNTTHNNVTNNNVTNNNTNLNSTTSSKGQGKYLPTLVAFARNAKGEITGGQQIFLDKKSGAKADLAVPKRSFGVLAGSFVEIGSTGAGKTTATTETKELNSTKYITIIAEGLETALSIEQALNQKNNSKSPTEKNITIKTLCSLGISNIKNYNATKGEKIIIAADNDGIESNTNKTFENAKIALEAKGAFVEIVKPSERGDFNDVLQEHGPKAIATLFESILQRHTAGTLKEYIATYSNDSSETKDSNSPHQLNDQDKVNLAYLQKYKFPEAGIIDAYRQGEVHGKIYLDDIRKKVEYVSQDMNFLIKHEIKPQEELVKTIIDSNDIKLTAEIFQKECHSYSTHIIDHDLRRSVRLEDCYGEKELIEFLSENSNKHHEALVYINDELQINQIKDVDRRIEVYQIAELHKLQNPAEAQKFKQEFVALRSYGNSTDQEEALACYKAKGLVSATEFAEKKNSEFVLSRLQYKSNQLKSNNSERGLAYIKDTAKDPQLMHYIDKALSNNQSLKNEYTQGINLEDYTNQRDINNVIEQLSGKRENETFKSNASDLQKFGSTEQVKTGLEIYNNKGIEGFSKYTSIVCTKNISKSIERNLENIGYGKQIESFDDTKHNNKSSYFAAISDDKQVMKYIEPKSNLGQELQKEKPQQIEKSPEKNFDLEK
ncbi:MAG: AAA family ATPase [Rickettsiaceae bacterium]|nr:AAA family ATPase [Rickettsiaceae bacterium]